MAGGVDIDEDEMKKLPDSKYWKIGAKWAKDQIYNMFVDEQSENRVSDILCRFYNNSNTWMKICLRSEHMLDLCKALVKEK